MLDKKVDILVIGAGPAGYAAAFRCADLGMKTAIIEKYDTMGGVCLNVGCIPSKALLHVASIIENAQKVEKSGVSFSNPTVDLKKLREWKQEVINQLTGGLSTLAKQRNVEIIKGRASFLDKNSVKITSKESVQTISFDKAIIATGSSPATLPFAPKNDTRIWNSTDALSIPFIPKKLLVIGGGIIGLEMATVYKSLGSTVHIVEYDKQLIPIADKDVVSMYSRVAKKSFTLMTKTGVTAIIGDDNCLNVEFEGKKAPSSPQSYDAILVAIGRTPSGKTIDAENAGVNITPQGFIETDSNMRTSVPDIYAVGDVTGGAMLAHKGAAEGHVAANAIAGNDKNISKPELIPSIAYTHPEIAWVGLTEKEAKANGINYETAVIPWAVLGRAIASDAANGRTKLIFDKDTNVLIGGAVIGENAGELLGEITLAIQSKTTASQLAHMVHAHPSLYESIGLAAELQNGSITDMLNKKR